MFSFENAGVWSETKEIIIVDFGVNKISSLCFYECTLFCLLMPLEK